MRRCTAKEERNSATESSSILPRQNVPFEREQNVAIHRPSQGDGTKQLIQKILLLTFNITESIFFRRMDVLSSLTSVF